VLFERHASAKASATRAVLPRERLADHLARFEWPSEDERAIDISSPEALKAYLYLVWQGKGPT
jgi:hypothetical protein